MPKKISLAIAALLCFVLMAIAEDPTKLSNAPVDDAPAGGGQVDQQLLNDLARIRKKMGGSVLSGSVLDPGDEGRDAAFQQGVQTLLEKSETDSKPTLPKFDEPAPQRVKAPSDIVSALRDQGVQLERIANDLERVKQYGHADELRDSAKTLRLLARQLASADGAEGADDRYATIENGRLTLHGTFESLAGIRATSTGGHLSITDNPKFVGMKLPLPFSERDGTIIKNTPNSVVIGVLGADRRIHVEGDVATSFLYSESEKVAINGDLVVTVGLGDNRPTRIPIRKAKASN